jgi:hypothetical protein
MSKLKDSIINSKDFINGMKEIDLVLAELKDDSKLSAIYICSGERDAMNIAGMGYHPVWFNSETTHISYEQYMLHIE